MKILSAFAFLLFFSQSVVAQQFSIKGSLKNGLTSEMIQGAAITLKGTAFSAVSKSDGEFVILKINVDKFVLNINAEGFQSYQAQINVKEDLSLGTITLYPMGYEAPTGALQKTIRATNVAEMFINRPNFLGGNAVYGIPSETKKLIGDFYLDPNWSKASILLYDKMEVMEGFFVRYNINSNMFEIKAEDSDQVRIIPGLKIRNIVWIDAQHRIPRYFVNGMDLKEDGTPISGFFEVLVDGEMPLVRRTKAIIKESNYNTALMIGEKDDQIIKRDTYYYIQGKDIIEIPKNRKNLMPVFGGNASEMTAFASQNKVNLKETSGLFVLFTQYNSLFEGFEPLMPKATENQ